MKMMAPTLYTENGTSRSSSRLEEKEELLLEAGRTATFPSLPSARSFVRWTSKIRLTIEIAFSSLPPQEERKEGRGHAKEGGKGDEGMEPSHPPRSIFGNH